ncbi:MAG: VCBS repeat-containing protein [Myxococcales bacterium]|nr:VCBS repeat-containing protein [Myxococcales bacterium]
MGVRGRLARLIGASIALYALAGCSLLLDPDVCTDDSECNGGVCSSGICVGGGAAPPADMRPMDSTPGDQGDSDAPDDAGVDAESPADQDVDQAVVDMRVPDAERFVPACDVLAPPPETLTGAESITVEVAVSDRDDGAGALTVTLGGEPIEVDGEGRAQVEVALAEGENRIVLEATDPDAQSCRAEVVVTADRTAPRFAGLVPAPDSETLTRVNPFPINGRVIDDHFASSLRVSVDGEMIVPEVTWNDDAFSLSVELSDGPAQVELIAFDAVGNESAPVQFEVELDADPPEVIIDQPAADDLEVVTDRVQLMARVLDDGQPVPRASYTLTIEGDNGQMPVRIAGQTNPDGLIDRAVPLFDGRNTVTAAARDLAGNEGQAVRTVVRANAMPCIDIVAPVDGAFVGAAQVELSGTVCPAVNEVELQVAGAPAVDGAIAAGGFSGTVMLPGPGQHRLVAIARSPAGEARDEVTVLYDDTPPSLRLTEPAANRCTNVQNVTLCGEASDAESRVATLTVQAADGAPVPVDFGGQGIFCRDVAVPEGAAVRLQARAENRAGLASTAETTIRVDRVAPTVTMDTPRNAWLGVNAARQVVLSGQVQGGVCEARQVLVDGGVVNLDAGGRFSARRAYADGPHEAAIQATDVADNMGVTMYVFRVDSQPPTITNLMPPVDSITADTLALLSAHVEDPAGSGVVTARLGGQDVRLNADGPGFRIDRAVDLQEGLNTFAIEAVDLVGNTQRAELRVVLDTTPPEVTVTAPAIDGPTPVPVIATGTVDDGPFGSGVASVTVNGMPATIDEEAGTWRAVVPVDPDDPLLIISATDQLGNTLDPPIEHPVTVRAFGAVPSASDGLDAVPVVGFVATADFDGNGRLDVLALTADPNAASAVFLQQDDGSFETLAAAQAGLPENFSVRDAVVADFDADGRLDILLAGAGRMEMLLGNGNGVFRIIAGSGLPGGLADPRLVVGDLTRNNHLDVLVLSGPDSRLLISNGNGTFEREPLVNLGLNGVGVYRAGQFVDVTGDDLLDLVAVGNAGGALWTGNRDNPFTRAPAGSGFPDVSAQVLLPIDGDRDGRIDVLSAGGGQVRFALNQGDAVFASDPMGLAWRPSERGAERLDYNGDGRDDVLVFGDEGLRLWRSTDQGYVLTDTAALGLPVGPAPFVAVADIDGDGDDDLLIGADDGVHFVRSNLAALTVDYHVAGLDIRRALPPPPANQGPRDAVGVLLYVDEDGDEVPDRALAARRTASTLISLGAAEAASLAIHYVDLGGPGLSIRNQDVASGQSYSIYARE